MNSAQSRVQRILLGGNFIRSHDLTTLNPENFDRIMAESLHKAIDNPDRCPVKEKHVRRLLIGAYQSESGTFFWKHLPVIRLKEEMLACWKFCYVLHKMLRDGPKQFLRDSIEHKNVLLDCGNMWRYVEDRYGRLILRYCCLLYNRINFLSRNPFFPNDLKMNEDMFKTTDITVLFIICSEIFDAIDDIDSLIEKALHGFDKQGLSSSTNAGKCLLGPLVACVQDASLLYDYCIKIMYRLHNSFDLQTLEGHRDRFKKAHYLIYKIFLRTRDIHYFQTLLQIPQVSKEPVDFSSASADIQKHSDAAKVTMIEASGEDELDNQLLVDVAGTDDTLRRSVEPDSSSNLIQTNQEPQSFPSSSNEISTSRSNQDDPFSLVQPSSSVADSGDVQSDNVDSYEHKLEQYENTISQLEHQVIELRRSLEDEKTIYSKLLEESQKRVEEIEEDRCKKVKESESEVKKLKDETMNLKLELNQTKANLVEAREQCEKANHTNEIGQIAVRKMASEMNQLKKEMEKLRDHGNEPDYGALSKKHTNDTSEQVASLTKQNQELSKRLIDREKELQDLKSQLDELTSTKARLQEQIDTNQSNLMMAEMIETDRIIKEATNRIEELSEKSRKNETGIKLQVNEKISEVCTNLMKAVRNLMVQSDHLQREVVRAHGMINNVEDFYKRNSSWTEGLISAAKEVTVAAKSLVDAADRAMSGEGKYSELSAAAHEIAAATTQLVVASRVKADKDSEKLKLLLSVAKQVNQCTGNVVSTAKICADLIESDADKEFDVSSLSLHQTKKLEMETQVKLLELDNAISKERIKLGALRRRHYEQEEQMVDPLAATH